MEESTRPVENVRPPDSLLGALTRRVKDGEQAELKCIALGLIVLAVKLDGVTSKVREPV